MDDGHSADARRAGSDVDWAVMLIAVISTEGDMATKRELGETRTQRLERFALRGAAAERELHETKQALAEMTQRAEAAETKLAVLVGADKPNKPATPTQMMRHWMLVASDEKHRADAAEHQLAAVPWEALTYCWNADTAEREEDEWERHSAIVDNWLHVYMPQQEAQK
jgi:hypothetical protein